MLATCNPYTTHKVYKKVIGKHCMIAFLHWNIATWDRNYLLILLFIFGSYSSIFAQKTREQLEREKKQNIEKIAELNQVLEKKGTQKNVSMGHLKALTSRIEVQGKQIDIITDDLSILGSDLRQLQKAFQKQVIQMQSLEKEYGLMIYTAAKNSNQFNKICFLFSAKNFNEFVMRFRYIKQYSEARQKQAQRIRAAQEQLLEQQNTIKDKKKEEENVLKTKITESEKLADLQQQQASLVIELSQQQKDLRNEIEKRKENLKRLDGFISSIIEREIRESRRRQEKAKAERIANKRKEREKAELLSNGKETKKNDSGEKIIVIREKTEEPEPALKSNEISMDKEEITLSSSFGASKNRLPWPVNQGFISDHFGTKAHPVLKGIKIDNNGIDIQTQAGENVRVVYAGIVRDVNAIPGMGQIVLVQHGNFFTVYSKLRNVSVQTGQNLKAREFIGEVSADSDGTSEINFQIWKNTTRLNPENWLNRR